MATLDQDDLNAIGALIDAAAETEIQRIRDAMALALSVGTVPVPGSIDALLAGLQVAITGALVPAPTTPVVNYPPKQPLEASYYKLGFEDELGVEAIASLTVAVADIETEEDATDMMIVVAKTTSVGATAYFWLQAGTPEHAYRITVMATGVLGAVATKYAAILVTA